MYNDKESVRFFSYSMFHGKYEPVGSDFLRVHQLIKHWPEAELYKFGEKPDVLIFTKVFMSQDYQFPAHFPGIKILDICDPMWMDNFNIVETAHAMDAVTTSTEELANFIRQFHSNVHVVPDRFDLDIPSPRKPLGRAKSVVWFGYSHNAELLRPALPLIQEHRLKLLIISNDDPLLNRWIDKDLYSYKKYNEDTIWIDIQEADFAVLPDGHRPVDPFKSNNRTIRANLAGLPVAKTPEEVESYLEVANRVKWLDNYDKLKQEYDVKNSIEQYREIIKSVISERNAKSTKS